MAELTHEQKLEILDKWIAHTATEEEVAMMGGHAELVAFMLGLPDEEPKGRFHVYCPGKISRWVD